MASGRILLEVCVDSAAGLRAAIAGGADRIELCSALALGGLTPSPGLMALAGDQPVPVRAMIRPWAGDFRYDRAARDILRRDIDAARAAGLAGVVIGATLPGGGAGEPLAEALDVDLLRDLAAHAAGMRLTLHRAVDLVADAVMAVDAAIAIGFDTILTSGGALTAAEGSACIAAMRARAGGRIAIIAGSGVGPDNVAALIAATGIRAVHASCGSPVVAGDPRTVQMGFAPATMRETDPAIVAQLRHILDQQG